MGTGDALPLICPACASRHTADERFCPRCGTPLVHTDAPDLSVVGDAHERARKIKPQYAEGELVKVGWGRNQAEAEFVAGLLLEEGVPSLVRRARGFDVPDFLAAGPRDVLVPASGAAAAREILLEAELVAPGEADRTPPLRVLVGVLVGFTLIAVVVLLLG